MRMSCAALRRCRVNDGNRDIPTRCSTPRGADRAVLGASAVGTTRQMIAGISEDVRCPAFVPWSAWSRSVEERPAPAGTVCPGSGSACTNLAAEPAIRASRDGSFYATSENGLGGGTLAWKSTDGGLHYASLLSPNGGS